MVDTAPYTKSTGVVNLKGEDGVLVFRKAGVITGKTPQELVPVAEFLSARDMGEARILLTEDQVKNRLAAEVGREQSEEYEKAIKAIVKLYRKKSLRS